MTTQTVTLDTDDLPLIIASLSKSARPQVRAIAVKLRAQVTLPLRCPVAWSEGHPEVCGDFAGAVVTDEDIATATLAEHLITVHGQDADPATFHARVAYKRWEPATV